MQGINRRKATLSILFVLILIVIALFVGKFTFSYMGPDLGDDLIIEGDVTAAGDTLIFSKGNDLSLSATTDSFNSTSGNLTATTNPKVTLRNNTKDGANAKYYAGVVINKNTFTYSTPEKTAEILLTVKDENGNIVSTSSDTLEYKTVNGVSGFDITNKSGVYNIVADHSISATTSTTHTWTFTITFINLTTDQSINENATLELEASLYKERIESLASHIKSLYTTQGANHLYKHNGSIMLSDGTTVIDAEDNSIRYAGGEYKVTDAYKDTYTRITSAKAADDSAIIGFWCDTVESYVGASCTAATRYFFLYYDEARTQYGTYKEAIDKTVTDGYVEATPVNNYVCFGSNEEYCPDNNLYRIIGVFDNQVKLIKADYATSELLGTDGTLTTTVHEAVNYSGYRGKLSQIYNYKWKNASPNTWSESELNTINLNNNFLTNIGEELSHKIAVTTWYVSGGIASNLRDSNAKTTYDYELGTNKLTVHEPYKAKIGLMYLSDYYYAANASEWTKPGSISDDILDYRSAKDNNWMYLGHNEWTISRMSSNVNFGFFVHYNGRLSNSNVYNGSGIRPSLYLEASATYAGGDGSISNPYTIGM